MPTAPRSLRTLLLALAVALAVARPATAAARGVESPRPVPTVVTVYLDRPAIRTPLEQRARAVIANFGASDAALLDVVTGRAKPERTLPFELPSSPSAVEALCVGEVLWDSLPAGLSLGGAPLNVACHLRALGVPVGVVSRVGADALGDDALRAIARQGIGTELVQVDAARPTGFVKVDVRDSRNSTYEIVEPAAWDAIELTDALVRRAAAARFLVFGSLAQRHPITRATIARLLDTGATRVFDVNLRPPHLDPEVVRGCLRQADLVKLNDDELRQLAAWFGLPAGVRAAASALAATFDCRMVCVTRGRDGAAMWHDGAWTEHPGFEVAVADTVGAGDAFLAAVLSGVVAGASDRALLAEANRLGAYVATRVGAVPEYREGDLTRVAEARPVTG